MSALLWMVLAGSLLGSLHCVGMCGGFVAFCANGVARGRGAAVLGAYHAGRLSGYGALGALFGGLGTGLDAIGAFAGVQRAAAAAGGALILLWGVHSLLVARGFRLPSLRSPALAARWARAGIARVAGMPPARRALAIGLCTALLPCGWLYAFVFLAAGTGSALGGALTMAVFWAGSLPALAALGAGVHLLAPRVRRHFPALAALALVVAGSFALFERAAALDGFTERVRAQDSAAIVSAAAERAQSAEPACCSD